MIYKKINGVESKELMTEKLQQLSKSSENSGIR